jgi:hypothetical protein
MDPARRRRPWRLRSERWAPCESGSLGVPDAGWAFAERDESAFAVVDLLLHETEGVKFEKKSRANRMAGRRKSAETLMRKP